MGTATAQPNLESRERLAGPAARGFRRIAKLWGVTVEQQLALLGESVSRSALHEWDKHPPKVLTVDQFIRMSYLVGIYEGLQRIYRHNADEGDGWVQRANSDAPFNGSTPLDFMLRGHILALAAARAYIDSVTGGPPSREHSFDGKRR